MGGIDSGIADGAKQLVQLSPVLGFAILVLLAAVAGQWFYYTNEIKRLNKVIVDEIKAGAATADLFRKTFEDAIDRMDRQEVRESRRRTT
jgi:hypothetical protein